MRLIDTYRATLMQLRESVSEPFKPAELRITQAQLPILNLLNTESVISLRSVQAYADVANSDLRMSEDDSAELVQPFDGYIVSLEVNEDPEEIISVRERLRELDLWNAKRPEFVGIDSEDEEDGRTVMLATHSEFTYFGNGLHTYRGKILHLPRQQSFLFGLFMESYGTYISAQKILDCAGLPPENYPGPAGVKKASKVVSPLNQSLKEMIGYAPITSYAGRGWILDFDAKAKAK